MAVTETQALNGVATVFTVPIRIYDANELTVSIYDSVADTTTSPVPFGALVPPAGSGATSHQIPVSDAEGVTGTITFSYNIGAVGQQNSYNDPGGLRGSAIQKEFGNVYDRLETLDAQSLQNDGAGGDYDANGAGISEVGAGTDADDGPNLGQVLSTLPLVTANLNANAKKITNLAAGAAASTDADRVVDRETAVAGVQADVDDVLDRALLQPAAGQPFDAEGQKIENVDEPVLPTDAATRAYVDDLISGGVVTVVPPVALAQVGMLLNATDDDPDTANWTDEVGVTLKFPAIAEPLRGGASGRARLSARSDGVQDHWIWANNADVVDFFDGATTTGINNALPIGIIQFVGGRFRFWYAASGWTVGSGNAVVTEITDIGLVAGSPVFKAKIGAVLRNVSVPISVRLEFQSSTLYGPLASFIALPFGAATESFDDANFHDTAVNNERITIPVAGTYLISGGIRVVSGDGQRMRTGIRLNGSTFYALQSTPIIGDLAEVNISTINRFTAGQYVELVFIHSGTYLGIDANPATNFCATLLQAT